MTILPLDTRIPDLNNQLDRVESYTIDGTGNNLAQATLGGAGTDEIRLASALFAASGTNTPIDGPNPRLNQGFMFMTNTGNEITSFQSQPSMQFSIGYKATRPPGSQSGVMALACPALSGE